MADVLITGGSSGIGFELARKFASEGYPILLAASNLDKLQNAKEKIENEYHVCVTIYQQDLAKIGAAYELYRKIKDDGKEVSILVNNAGIGAIGPAENIEMIKDEQMMLLNMVTPVELMKLYLKEMYEKESGKILNVCSTGAFQPGPYTATYYASKSFLLNYTKAVRFEAKEKKVQVCALCPGTTDTAFFSRANIKTPNGALPPEKVADYAYKAFMKNKEVIIPGLKYRFMKLAPVKMKTAVIALIKKRQNKSN